VYVIVCDYKTVEVCAIEYTEMMFSCYANATTGIRRGLETGCQFYCVTSRRSVDYFRTTA